MLADACSCHFQCRRKRDEWRLWNWNRGLLPRVTGCHYVGTHVEPCAVCMVDLQIEAAWHLLAHASATLIVLLSAIMVNIQPMLILVIGSWKLCCAPCTNYQPNMPHGCTTSDFTYPAWSDNNMRACSAPGGNLFWDVSYCTGSQYPIFPTVASGWTIQCICTWGGYVLMFVGVFQATKLHMKLVTKWRAIRGGGRSVSMQPSPA